MRVRIYAKFEPLPDITTYELAQLVANFAGYCAPKNGVLFDLEAWDNLSQSLKRHFMIVPTPPLKQSWLLPKWFRAIRENFILKREISVLRLRLVEELCKQGELIKRS